MAEDMKPHAPGGLPGAPHPLRHVLIGLLVAPLAWILQMTVAEMLAAQSCFPYDHPLSEPVLPWMNTALVVLGALCLMAGTFGTWVAWRQMRQLGPVDWAALDASHRKRVELQRFLLRVAALCSTLFLIALIAVDAALAIVSPCKWW
ncbi:hypothetical protein VOM14_07700 [Paraburkholderia sp. MPAMCS5]|uniref:hypothetical protein n=1 Tax=Paraburkholderia sp. MPAMCS5 TaxID=3112563 RepID=UPI002E187071|nr:hypothetical protein [Paraburkholderia sp. MPAMCS5]